MDAQGAHRWAGETRGGGGGRGSNYIAKHIGIQNQVPIAMLCSCLLLPPPPPADADPCAAPACSLVRISSKSVHQLFQR
jgi:hypothetical protein